MTMIASAVFRIRNSRIVNLDVLDQVERPLLYTRVELVDGSRWKIGRIALEAESCKGTRSAMG